MAKAKNAARRRPARKKSVARRKNLFGFGSSDTTKFRGSLESRDADRVVAKHIPQLRKQVRQALADAKKRKQSIRGVDLDTDVDLVKNARRVRRKGVSVRRDRMAKKNAFGLDRFVGRKKRVTSETYQRAGTKTRSKAYQRAGVSKKLTPAYTNLEWPELQQLEPSFVKKVMRGLNPRKISRQMSRAIGKKIRQLRREGVAPKQAVAIAFSEARQGRFARSGKRLPKPRRGARRNPVVDAERAGARYAMFHGRGPSRVVEVKELAPKDMAALGDLEALILGNNDYQIHWGKGERPLLAMDTDCEQLYIVGGDQKLPDTLLKAAGASGSVDTVDLGEVKQIEYFTQKGFDSYKPIVYYHEFGEEDAKKNPRKVRRPRLLYSRRYRKLMLAGGAYKIRKEGIIN